jgi:hypothetical protein
MIGRNGEGGERNAGKEPGYLGDMPSGTCGNKAWTRQADDADGKAIGFRRTNGTSSGKVSGTDPKIGTKRSNKQWHLPS